MMMASLSTNRGCQQKGEGKSVEKVMFSDPADGIMDAMFETVHFFTGDDLDCVRTQQRSRKLFWKMHRTESSLCCMDRCHRTMHRGDFLLSEENHPLHSGYKLWCLESVCPCVSLWIAWTLSRVWWRSHVYLWIKRIPFKIFFSFIFLHVISYQRAYVQRHPSSESDSHDPDFGTSMCSPYSDLRAGSA